MKKSLKLFTALSLAIGLFLTGCNKGGQPTPPTPEVVHVTGVTSTEESFSIEVGEEHELVYVIAPEEATDKSVTVSSESSCISIEGTTVTGELAGDAEVLLTTVDGNFSITYTITVVEPIIKEFPAKDVIAFFEEAGIDVVIPNYVVASEEAYFEIDDSYEGYFDVYVTGSSHEEMIDYKDALLYDGWIVVGTSEDGDYKMQFGSTAAFVDLIDFSDYIGVSFYHEEVTPSEGMGPEEAMTEFSGYFGATATEVESGVFGFYQAWLYDEEENNPAALMEYVDMVFEYVLTEFTGAGEWTESEGANVKYFVNEIATAFEIYVYEDNVWVKDGYIVDEGTEGAESVHVVCVESYSYSVAE